MELNTGAPSFTQTFLKQYCDQKAWKIPGGQGRLDRAQLSPSEREEEGKMGSPSVRMEGSSSDLATAWYMGAWVPQTGFTSHQNSSWELLNRTDGLSPDMIEFLFRITTRAISTSSVTSVVPPSDFLDNKLLFPFILKQNDIALDLP